MIRIAKRHLNYPCSPDCIEKGCLLFYNQHDYYKSKLCVTKELGVTRSSWCTFSQFAIILSLVSLQQLQNQYNYLFLMTSSVLHTWIQGVSFYWTIIIISSIKYYCHFTFPSNKVSICWNLRPAVELLIFLKNMTLHSINLMSMICWAKSAWDRAWMQYFDLNGVTNSYCCVHEYSHVPCVQFNTNLATHIFTPCNYNL